MKQIRYERHGKENKNDNGYEKINLKKTYGRI